MNRYSDQVEGSGGVVKPEIDRLVRVVQSLSRARSVEDIAATVRRGARAITGADGVTFILREGNDCHYADEDAIRPLWKGRRFPIESCASGWAMQSGSLVVIEDIYQDPRIPHDGYRSTFVKSLAIAPIRRDAAIGAIGLYWASVQKPSDEVLELLQTLADSCSVAFENVCLFQDLTERVRALAASEERLALTQKAARISGWEWDCRTSKVIQSGAVEEVYGRCVTTQEELFKNVHPDDLEALQRAISQALADGEAYHHDFRYVLPDGSIRWLSATGKVYRDAAGEPIRMLGVTQNVDQIKRTELDLKSAMEAADTANHMKSAFLANMSHEIRTPLNAVMGFSELMVEHDVDPKERRDIADTIRRNGVLLTQLIDDILDLSKVEAGKLLIERVPLSLPDLIADVASVVRAKAVEKGLFIRFMSQGSVPEHISVDPVRLKQILINVIGNAVKFTNSGDVQVTVREARSEAQPATRRIEFIVKDTGRGIAPAERAQLFQPFMQADVSTTRKFGGTGLGLTLSQRLARALGGDVELVQSTPGAGSTFSISITTPIADGSCRIGAAKPGDGTGSDEGFVSQNRLRGTKVLVVDDVRDNQVLVMEILRRSGASVELAENGEEAFRKASQREYDVVLMDLQMPIRDGYEATMDLRRQGYQRPILALSAGAMKSDKDRALAAGCNDHLTKPINAQLLLQKVEQYAARE